MSRVHNFSENLYRVALERGCPSLLERIDGLASDDAKTAAGIEWVEATLKPAYRRYQPKLKDEMLHPTPGAVECVKMCQDMGMQCAVVSQLLALVALVLVILALAEELLGHEEDTRNEQNHRSSESAVPLS